MSDNKEKGKKDDQYQLRCSFDERLLWEQAAKNDDRKLSDWIRSRLNRAAKSELHRKG